MVEQLGGSRRNVMQEWLKAQNKNFNFKRNIKFLGVWLKMH